MGPVNTTILRCADAVFKINPHEMNQMKIATQKQQKAATAAMQQRNQMPIFSGNIESYLINQLLEYELICKVKNVMSTEDTSRVHHSALFPYYQRMAAQANKQFTEPAAELSKQ